MTNYVSENNLIEEITAGLAVLSIFSLTKDSVIWAVIVTFVRLNIICQMVAKDHLQLVTFFFFFLIFNFYKFETILMGTISLVVFMLQWHNVCHDCA